MKGSRCQCVKILPHKAEGMIVGRGYIEKTKLTVWFSSSFSLTVQPKLSGRGGGVNVQKNSFFYK